MSEYLGDTAGKGDLLSHEINVKTGADINLDTIVEVEHVDMGQKVICKVSDLRLRKGNLTGTIVPLIRIPTPFQEAFPVNKASREDIIKALNIEPGPTRIHIGNMRSQDIPVYLNLNDFIHHVNVVGRSGKGKTYLISVMLEEIAKLNNGVTAVVFDIRGDLIRLNECPSFSNKIIIHNLDESVRYLTYEKLYNKGKVTIVNLAKLGEDSIETAVKLMLWQLWDNKSPERPVLLFIDEAHKFSPQQGTSKATQYMESISGEGRGSGIAMIRITQRPAKISKNVWSQAGVNVIMGVNDPNDLKAVTSGVPGLKKEISTIQKLARGEAVMYGGNISTLLVVKVKKRDSPDKENVKFIG